MEGNLNIFQIMKLATPETDNPDAVSNYDTKDPSILAKRIYYNAGNQ